MSDDMIRSEKLTFEYVRRDDDGNVEGIERALDGVYFYVYRGEFLAIIGCNG